MPARPADEHRLQARRAIALAIAIAGNQVELARKITEYFAEHGLPDEILTKVGVGHWLQYGSLLKEKYWEPIEAITDYAVTRRYLRPDLFGMIDQMLIARAAELTARWEVAA